MEVIPFSKNRFDKRKLLEVTLKLIKFCHFDIFDLHMVCKNIF